MSAGVAIPAGEAHEVADHLIGLLAASCNRIRIAGSLRRGKQEVHDIELVATPRFDFVDGADLWGTTVGVDRLEERVRSLIDLGFVRLRDVESHKRDGTTTIGHRDGDSYKALECSGIPVDLFIVRPPAEWGVIFAIRTGPGDWNQRIVTDCQKYLRRVHGGRVYRNGKPVPCPEEEDFFRAVGQEYLHPRERRVDRVRITP